jgi:hypothetical protein
MAQYLVSGGVLLRINLLEEKLLVVFIDKITVL